MTLLDVDLEILGRNMGRALGQNMDSATRKNLIAQLAHCDDQDRAIPEPGMWDLEDLKRCSTFSKSIDYRTVKLADSVIRDVGLEDYLNLMLENGSRNPVQDMATQSLKSIHMSEGSQFVVDEGVSKELSVTDLSSVMPDVLPWPSTTVEFFFEEKGLPTVLIYNGSMEGLFNRYNVNETYGIDTTCDWRPNAQIIAFLVEARPPPARPDVYQSRMMIVDSTDSWHAVMRSETAEDYMSINPVDENGMVMDTNRDMSMDECFGELRQVFQLCIKSLVYSSIPRYSKKMYHGKRHHARSGVRGRPHRPVQRVVYLPKVVRPQSKEGSSDEKRNFNGRRGHIRYYGHERYVKKQGTFDYIPPILGPNGELPKTIYKVRKVK